MTELTLAGPRPAISDVAQDQLAAWLVARGEPAYRASQILAGVYRAQARRFEDLTDLPIGLRPALEDGHQRGELVGRLEFLVGSLVLLAQAVHICFQRR